ncbi:MAG: gamma-glutamyl-gamma-aminobutyrate hydrolase family protein [Ectobacillus sp.]
MPPFIGISGTVMLDESKRFPGYKRAYVGNDYVEAVALAGGAPVIMPILDDEALIKQQVERVDGVILSGGQDVNPLLYGEEPSKKLGKTFPERDLYEQRLIQCAMEKKKPILAICRGMQILNAACGGTLYQDISLIDGAALIHNQRSTPSLPTHSVIFKKDTHLYKIYGDRTNVNSFHHQAVKKVAPGFRIAALSEDGVIEAIEKDGDDFVVGVQWHPEMMAKAHPHMLSLFKLFIEQVKQTF